MLEKLREYAPHVTWTIDEDTNGDGAWYIGRRGAKMAMFLLSNNVATQIMNRDDDVAWLDIKKLARQIQRDLGWQRRDAK